jgi:hypothetical protein
MTAALLWMNAIGVGAPTALRLAATTASGCGLRLRSTAVIGKPFCLSRGAYGFGEVRVATLALLIFTALSG